MVNRFFIVKNLIIFLKVLDVKSGLCEGALRQTFLEKPQSILSPFQPILHSIIYVQKHAYLLNELCQNYEFADT